MQSHTGPNSASIPVILPMFGFLLEMLSEGKHKAQEGLLWSNEFLIPYRAMSTTRKCFNRLKLFLVITKKLKGKAFPQADNIYFIQKETRYETMKIAETQMFEM